MITCLKNARIYDGTGNEPYTGDIYIENDRIVSGGRADRVIDCAGLSAAPGFIDCHSHNDWFAIKKDPVPCFEPFIRQGITTFVAGNCGLSAIGFERDTKHTEKIGGGLFRYDDTIKGVYPDAAGFFDAIDGNMPCNLSTLVGHCSARASVAGYENRPLTQDEEKRMLAILERDLQAGAAGVSLGLMYEPGLYAGKDELRKVAELCARYGKLLTVHARAESAVSMAYPQLLGRSHLLRAVDELCEITKGLKLKLQYSHAIFVGRRSLKDKPEFLKLIDDMRRDGVDAQFDIYDETEGVSVITVILPVWYQGMSEEERDRFATKAKLSLLVNVSKRLLGFGFDDITVAYIGEGYEAYEGKTVHRLAQEQGKKDLAMYLELCRLSNFKGRVNMGPYTTPEIIREFEKNPLCLYMTDAWLEEHGIQNPALYECFPRFLQDSVAGRGDTLQATVRRMTGATADRYGLRDRGYIREGCYADITVFDEKKLAAGEPDGRHAFGIERVFINGASVLEDGRLVETRAGRAVRT